MTAKEGEKIHQMQQSPEKFDSKQLKINIECPEPSDIASRMTFDVGSQQSDFPSSSNLTTEQVIPSAPYIPEPNIQQNTNSVSQLARMIRIPQEKFSNTFNEQFPVNSCVHFFTINSCLL